MSDIHIYKENGKVSVDVLVENETVWLSLNQLSELFERDKSVISRHIKNIFDREELNTDSVVAKLATTANDGKIYQVDHYNLDLILSVGYRINSKRGTQFRQWANSVLKEYLIQGYALNQKVLAKGLTDLERSIGLLDRTFVHKEALPDIAHEAMRIIQEYTRAWKLLLQYDEGDIRLQGQGNQQAKPLEYSVCLSCIKDLKQDLQAKGEASHLFGIEREEDLKGILGNLDQTFDGQPLYKTAEEAAAHLLYFVIKDHPFTDGNKRIGSLLFLLYLKLNGIKSDKINEVTLVTLALLVAESKPEEKSIVIPLIINLIT